MKFFTHYKFILLGLLLSFSAVASAQCPFVANITTTNAGGCGNANGSVFFSVVPNTPGSIVGTFYLVYRASDNVLVNSSTNTNPEVTVPEGSYKAEVKVQCSDGKTSSWTQTFVISKSTADRSFTATYTPASSRLTTLNAVASGMLAYTFTKAYTNSPPYMLDIIAYPAEYKGPYHFENIQDGVFKIENLPAGDYKVRMTNGCMVTTDGPRTIIKTTVDFKESHQFYGIVQNTQGGGILTSSPTTDHSTIYLQIYTSGVPADYWNTTISKDFYEFGWFYPSDGETAANITSWKNMSYNYSENRMDCKYTVKQMAEDQTKRPEIVVRIKNTNITKSYGRIYMYFTTYTVSKSPSTINCDNVDFKINKGTHNVLTYPLDIQITNYAGTTTLATHSVTAQDMTNNYVTIPNIDVSAGYRINFVCKGDETVAKTYTEDMKNITSYGDLIYLGVSSVNLTSYCSGEYAYVYFSSDVDLRGATIKYTGSIPLAGINTEFTVPTTLSSAPFIYLTQKGADPWTSGGDVYVAMPEGTYTWDVSIPCGAGFKTYTKSITRAAPVSNVTYRDESKFKPKMVSATSCGFVDIDLGSFTDLKDMFKTNNSSSFATTYITLCTKGENAVGGTYYSYRNNTYGVYYDGLDQNYFAANSANAKYTNPKIRVSRPGTYYLVAQPSTNGTVYASAAGSCFFIKEFTITDGDLKGTLDLDATAAYFCSQDKKSGIIFVQRQGTNTGTEFIFKITNSTLSYNKTLTSAEVQHTFDNIDIAQHGSQFSVSVEPVLNCSSTPSTALITMSEVGNSTAFVKQSEASDCYGTVELELEGIAYTAASYKWKDIVGTVLSNNNLLKGNFATGTRLFLEVTFEVTGPGGLKTKCGLWTKEYVVTGVPLTEYYWKNNATSNNWNSSSNWNNSSGATSSTIPGNCSCAYIPATVTSYYPDLASASPQATVTDIYFEYGAQLYNQHKLSYRNAYVSYNTGYYGTLPSPTPTALIQPTNSVTQVTASANYKASIAFANLPIIQRARWYMLATPLKGMYAGDFQMAAKPYTIQRYYKNVSPNPELLNVNNFTVTPANTIKTADYYNSIALWFPPYSSSTGANNQVTLESLKGSIRYPYFFPYLVNDEVISLRPDLAFNRTTNKMKINEFDMQSLAMLTSNEITRSPKSSRFVYEDDATDAIPAGESYELVIAADTERINGEVMIGNPFMAPLDFDKFLLANPGVMATSYKVVVNGANKQYDQANASDPASLGKYIAPMQSFIIKLLNPKAEAVLKFPISSVIATQNATTIKVKVQ